MKTRLFLLIRFSILLIPRIGLSQEYDSTFWAQHSYNRPDSVLLKDSFWFPLHPIWESKIYSERSEPASWAGPGARSYGNFGAYYSAVITLRENHSFVFNAGFEVGTSLTVGHWLESVDSIVTLQWDPTHSLRLCRDRKSYDRYFHARRVKCDFPWPIKIEDWRFIRRGDELVPKIG
jgi:hypothetical protein